MSTIHRTDQDRRNVEVFTAVIREGFNRGNLEALDDLFASDFIEHQRRFPTPDLDGLKRGISSQHAIVFGSDQVAFLGADVGMSGAPQVGTQIAGPISIPLFLTSVLRGIGPTTTDKDKRTPAEIVV